MNIEVYTDGSATTADKPGGYGWVIIRNGKKICEGSGYMEFATNNDAELEAAIQGLQEVNQSINRWVDEQRQFEYTDITLISDSQIVLGWANGTYSFKQVHKQEKFKQLQLLVQLMSVKTRWVEGHTGDEHNERCDKLANAARLQIPIDEYKLTKKKKKDKVKKEFKWNIQGVNHGSIKELIDNAVQYNKEDVLTALCEATRELMELEEKRNNE